MRVRVHGEMKWRPARFRHGVRQAARSSTAHTHTKHIYIHSSSACARSCLCTVYHHLLAAVVAPSHASIRQPQATTVALVAWHTEVTFALVSVVARGRAARFRNGGSAGSGQRAAASHVCSGQGRPRAPRPSYMCRVHRRCKTSWQLAHVQNPGTAYVQPHPIPSPIPLRDH